jgi:glyoxylase-like metal-dependent hydrolase (beta-lactamase superfamily II)
MHPVFIEEIENIYRLKIPFENLYTSVFLIKVNDRFILIDCATYSSDVDEYIIPALNLIKVRLEDIRYLILTHKHSDHAGGLEKILEKIPTLKVIDKVADLSFSDIIIYDLKGHTNDSIGVLDKRTLTLISGDGLQGLGVGKYRLLIENREEYIKTIDKIKKDKRVKNILFSHAYEPFNCDGIFGRIAVQNVLKECETALK